MAKKNSAEKTVRDIRRRTRPRFSAEENIRIVIEDLRGEESNASLRHRPGLECAIWIGPAWHRLAAGRGAAGAGDQGFGAAEILNCCMMEQLDAFLKA
jgi:hypothetical protein